MRIAVVVGTRPEVIKLAPLVRALRAHRGWDTYLIASAQHREMLDQALAPFGLQPNVDLDLMSPRQSLPDLTARVLSAMTQTLADLTPDLLIVQGDTTTVLGSALAAFYRNVPVAHVEAGLRTADVRRPFPEEANRRLTSVLTTLHFAPTESARDQLLREGVPAARIAVTGNTVVDAVRSIRDRLSGDVRDTGTGRRQILLTAHRRENWGAPLRQICLAVRRIVTSFDDVEVVYPVHLNPSVRELVASLLNGVPRVSLLPPQDYTAFVGLLSRSTLVITDSGGVQEEAPSLGKPVLVLRDATERPEACDAGVARVIGTDADAIVREVSRLLVDRDALASMVAAENPFGDGRASDRIVMAIQRWTANEAVLLDPADEFNPAPALTAPRTARRGAA